MNTHTTEADARAYCADKPKATHILQIVTTDGETCWLCTTCPGRGLEKNIPEVRKVLADIDLVAERIALAIPGLADYEAGQRAWSKYDDAEYRAIDSGECLRARKPAESREALRTSYPIAAAYCKAQGYSRASNYAKAGTGSRAVKRLEAGEDHETVIADMDAEWTQAAQRAVDNS